MAVKLLLSDGDNPISRQLVLMLSPWADYLFSTPTPRLQYRAAWVHIMVEKIFAFIHVVIHCS